MSDFLANLASRALALSQPVRPRVASLFEPSSAARPVAEFERDSVVEAAPPAADMASLAASPATPPLQRAMPPPVPTRSPPPPQPVAVLWPPQPSGEVTPAQPAATLAQSHVPAPPVLPVPVASLARVPPPQPIDVRPEPGEPVIRPLRATPAPPPVAAPAPPAPSTEIHIETRVVERIAAAREPAAVVASKAQAPGPPLTAPPPTGIRPQITPAAPARQAPVPAEPTPPPAPPAVVRVTIGRVEVRAITPPTAPAPPSRSARNVPVLTLDQYLQQRRGGQS